MHKTYWVLPLFAIPLKIAEGEVIEEKFYDLGKPFARLSMVDAILQYGKDHRGAETLDEAAIT